MKSKIAESYDNYTDEPSHLFASLGMKIENRGAYIAYRKNKKWKVWNCGRKLIFVTAHSGHTVIGKSLSKSQLIMCQP